MIKKSWLKEAIEDVAREWTIYSNIKNKKMFYEHKIFDILEWPVIESKKDIIRVLKGLRKRSITTKKGRFLLKGEYSLSLEV